MIHKNFNRGDSIRGDLLRLNAKCALRLPVLLLGLLYRGPNELADAQEFRPTIALAGNTNIDDAPATPQTATQSRQKETSIEQGTRREKKDLEKPKDNEKQSWQGSLVVAPIPIARWALGTGVIP